MGLGKDEERHLDALDSEEMLPLYEESRAGGGSSQALMAVPNIPDEKATPDEVRDFLVQLMLSRGSSLDHGRRVAAKWNLGTGRELRSYPIGMFRDMFGTEDGWTIYKEAKTQYYVEEAEKHHHKRNKLIWLCVSLVAVLISVPLVYTLGSDNLWTILAVLLGAAGMGSTIISLAVIIAATKPEDKAEKELQMLWHTTSNNNNNNNNSSNSS